MRKKSLYIFTAMILTAGLLSGCGSTEDTSNSKRSKVSVSVTESEDDQDEEKSKDAETAEDDAKSADSTDSSDTETKEYTVEDQFSERDSDASYEAARATHLDLSENGITVTGNGATASGAVATITEKGTYLLSGTLTGGQIIVDTEDKVQLVLSDVTMSNSETACIYVKNADKVFVTLADGTTNTLSDAGIAFEETEEGIDGVIYSKDDICFNGTGTLVVNANGNHAIVGKDDLKITGGTYKLTAVNKGIIAEDSIRILDGTIAIESGDDALHADTDDDETKGYVYIAGGSLTLKAGDDGIHAETALVIDDGVIDVSESYEGLEGATITVNGGDVRVKASDDGLNAPGTGSEDSANASDDGDTGGNFGTFDGGMPGNMGSERAETSDNGDGEMTQDGQQNRGGRNGFGGGGMMDADASAVITINGGNIYVDAGGDGIDSNGYIYVYGGNVTVDGPTNDGNGALDCGVSAEVHGGTVIAVGSSGMAETFGGSSTQKSVRYNFETAQAAGTEVTIEDAKGNVVLSYTPTKAYASIIFSSADLAEGTYTIRAGSTEATFDISSVTTSVGNGGGFGGGRQNGGFGGGMQDGELPEEIDPDNMPKMQDGQTPPDFGDGQTPPDMSGEDRGGRRKKEKQEADTEVN